MIQAVFSQYEVDYVLYLLYYTAFCLLVKTVLFVVVCRQVLEFSRIACTMHSFQAMLHLLQLHRHSHSKGLMFKLNLFLRLRLRLKLR